MVRPRQISINNVMVEYYSNYSWGMTGPNYSDIVWKSNPEDMPSIEELEEKRVILQQLEPLRFLREKRNILLIETDWVTLKAYSQGVEVPPIWKNYMQALRDLPYVCIHMTDDVPKLDEQGNLINVPWPDVPQPHHMKDY